MTKLSEKTSGEVWSNIWNRSFSDEDNFTSLKSEQESVRWRRIKKIILAKYGSFSNLKTIELGAGRGTYSLLASLEGAHASLLDNNETAFERAEEFFDAWGKKFEPIAQNAFGISDDHSEQFDIAMSFGLAEHFIGPDRFNIFEAHLKLLKPGGLLITSVPNRLFLPYRTGKWLLESLKKWEMGLEIPFSRKELFKIARELPLQNVKVIGSGLVEDTLNFWLIQRLLHLPLYVWDKSISVLWTQKSVIPLKHRLFRFSCHPNTFLDDFLGYALVLIGEKPV